MDGMFANLWSRFRLSCKYIYGGMLRLARQASRPELIPLTVFNLLGSFGRRIVWSVCIMPHRMWITFCAKMLDSPYRTRWRNAAVKSVRTGWWANGRCACSHVVSHGIRQCKTAMSYASLRTAPTPMPATRVRNRSQDKPVSTSDANRFGGRPNGQR